MVKPKYKSWRTSGLPVVYFLQADCDNALIKIGQSIDFAARFSSLCNDNACALQILGVVARPNQKAVRLYEAQLHARFAAHRHHSEWYLPREPLLTYIRTHGVTVDQFNQTLTAKIKAEEITLDECLRQAQPEALLTIDEVAELLHVQPISVRRQVDSRLLPCIRVGQKLLRFDRQAVLQSPFALALRHQEEVA